MSGKVCTVVGAEPGSPNVQGSSFLLLRYGYAASHLWRNLGIIVAMMAMFCAAHLLAAEYISAQKSKGDVLLFQHGHSKNQPLPALDPENAVVSPMFAQATNKQGASDTFNYSTEGVQTILQQLSVFHWNNLSYEVSTKTGASGGVYIDGIPRDASFQRRIGYVQQEDIHLPTATVRETLEFSALLRQSGTNSREEKLNYVNDIIRLLEMESYAEAVVGLPGISK